MRRESWTDGQEIRNHMRKLIYLSFICTMSAFHWSCEKSCVLDLSTIDSTFFFGVYTSEFENLKEQIILNENGYYDHYWESDSSYIKEAGKWHFYKKDGGRIMLTNFVDFRGLFYSGVYKSNKQVINFSIDKSYEIGSLETLVHGGDDYYAFRPDSVRTHPCISRDNKSLKTR